MICSMGRLLKIRRSLIAHVTKHKNPRYPHLAFITATIRNVSDLKAGIDTLYRHWTKWRNHREIRPLILGGAWALEITYNPKTKTWHPHIHCLLRHSFWDIDRLATLWGEIVGPDGHASGLQWDRVEEEKDAIARAIHYVTRYITKSSFPLSASDVVNRAVRGRKMCNCWGLWRIRASATIQKLPCPVCGAEGMVTLFSRIRSVCIPDIRMLSPPEIKREDFDFYDDRQFRLLVSKCEEYHDGITAMYTKKRCKPAERKRAA